MNDKQEISDAQLKAIQSQIDLLQKTAALQRLAPLQVWRLRLRRRSLLSPLATTAPHSDILITMNEGYEATTKRGVSSSSLSQSRSVTSTAGGKMVDRWIKGFDARQANFDLRHNALLNKLGTSRSAEDGQFRKK